MFISLINTLGRTDTINVRQINYVLTDKGMTFVNFVADGSSSPMVSQPQQIDDLYAAILAQPYFYDLRTANRGYVINIANLSHMDASTTAGTLICSFTSPKTFLHIPIAHQAALTAALLAYVEGSGTGPAGPTGATGAAGATGLTGSVSLDSPAFTGTPTAPTPATTDDGDRLATTAFTHALVQQEIDMQYARLIDSVGTDTMYIGEATPGALPASAVWRIKKVFTVGDDITITWAGGTAAFDKIWNNRLSLPYS